MTISINISAHERLDGPLAGTRHRLEIHAIVPQVTVQKWAGRELTCEQLHQVFAFLESDQLLRDRLAELLDDLLPDRITYVVVSLGLDDIDAGGAASYTRHIEGN